jgi:hypothetical protein
MLASLQLFEGADTPVSDLPQFEGQEGKTDKRRLAVQGLCLFHAIM